MKSFYVTSPIFYPNAQPHLGHAYTTLLCDVLARYHKSLGEETYFLTGTDEHTEKVVQAARDQGQDPQEHLEEIVERFKDLYARLDIAYDQFIRTSDQKVHWPGAVEMWNRLYEAGKLEKRQYTGLYCVGCEAFKTERELVDGVCPDHGITLEKITEDNWFFKLSEFSAQLKDLIESGALKIVPESRKNEVLSFIESGLEDVSFSRPKEKMTWGIPVPNDPTQTMYIWVDALTNYITALGFGRGEELMHFWPGVHILGKDIIRFHTVFWPAMLLTAGLPLPRTVFVHGTIISGGRKMSKSLGNVIEPGELVERYGVDATRYLLLRHVHPIDDTDVTWERLDEWYTAHLVHGLGNVVARVLTLTEKYLNSPIEPPAPTDFPKAYTDAIERFAFDEALNHAWTRIGAADQKITETEPFKLVKTDPERAKDILKELSEELYWIGRMLHPFMPEADVMIERALKQNKKPENLFPRLP